MKEPCPPKTLLHEYVDAALDGPRRSDFEAHLIRCSECRDAVRLLRRIFTFARAVEHRPVLDVSAIVARAREQAAPEIVRQAVPAPSRFGLLRRVAPVLAVASLLMVVGVASWTAGEHSIRDGAPETSPAPVEARPVAWTWPPSTLPLAEQVQRVFDGSGARQVAIQRAEELLRRRPFSDPELVSGLMILAQLGGPEAQPSVTRIVRARELTPEPSASALAATRHPRVAATIAELLRESPSGLRQQLLASVPGEDATRFLLDEWIRVGLIDGLEPTFLEREGLITLARRRAVVASRETRIRLWTLVGRLGGDDAVGALENVWREGGTPSEVIESLAVIGSTKAFEALARRLPKVDDIEEWPLDPEVELIEGALRQHATVAGPWLAHVMRGLDSVSDRRRLLIAAGLTRSPRVLPELRRALGRSQDRRAAILALALAEDGDSVPHLEALTMMEDLGTRRRAVRALGAIGTDDAVKALAGLLPKDRERRLVVDLLAKSQKPAATIGLIDGLRFEDTRERAVAALKLRAGPDAPATASPAAWYAYFRRSPGE